MMNKFKLFTILAGAVLLALTAGCDTTTNTNTNTNSNNANAAKANANETPAPGNSNSSNSNVSKTDVQQNIDKYKQQAKDLGRTIGSGAEDTWIWVKTRSTLAAADDLRDSTINVDVDNNVVTLTGSVANGAQKEKAGQLAKETEGVKSVTNELRIAADKSPSATDDKTAPRSKS